MVKFIIIISITTGVLFGNTNNYSLLQKDCINCHKLNSIPSEMIYRRYLLKYSSKKIIQEKISEYIKDPSPKKSIMPPQFFLKFSMKENSLLSDKIKKERIAEFIEYYDVNNRFFLPTSSL